MVPIYPRVLFFKQESKVLIRSVRGVEIRNYWIIHSAIIRFGNKEYLGRDSKTFDVEKKSLQPEIVMYL